MNEMEMFLQRLVEHGILPHAKAIAEIVTGGDIAIVVFQPHESIKPAIRAAGWDGKVPVFRMSRSYRQRLLKYCDAVTAHWLLKNPSLHAERRLLVCTDRFNILVNVADSGFSFEPGSRVAAFLPR